MLAADHDRIVAMIARALAAAHGGALPSSISITLERPKVEAHGDAACNVCLQAAKVLQRNPRELAQALVAALQADAEMPEVLASAEVAGPGFINVRLAMALRLGVVKTVLRQGEHFGCSTDGHDAHGVPRHVMVEFVSANPTGPLHMGHARQAALGDALASLLQANGWAVSREFYYNDAGVQIDKLALSVQARARELQGERIAFPEDGYRGDYVIDIARDFLARAVLSRDGTPVAASGDVGDFDGIRRYAVAFLRQEQDLDLAAFGVRFDQFYLESSLYTDGRVDAAVQALIDSGMTYERDGALWLRTTAIDALGGWPPDDQDRVMRKSDGTYTYFVPDVAYHLSKWQRGFTKVIDIQGSDHHGTVARVRAGLQAAGRALGTPIPPGYPEYVLHKMVRVMRGGQEVKMSKRAGTVVALRDLVDWVGRDAARYFLVSRKGDAEFTFDVDLALATSDENPVYYVQYAHARICSVLMQAAERNLGLNQDAASALTVAALAPLDTRAALQLIATLAQWPHVVREAARELAPHHVPNYLKTLSADFHAFYNADRVLVDEQTPREARLALLLATRQVLRNGLAMIGVSAPERLERASPPALVDAN